MKELEYLVSIRCMTYNHAPYIIDAMNGFCMQQTSFPFVAIIVDDASTDGEQEVISNYVDVNFDMTSAQKWESEDARFIEVVHKSNKNCFFAVVLLKKNLYQYKKRKVELIARWEENVLFRSGCEGDDYWTDSTKLQRQVDFLNSHKDYVAIAENATVLHTETNKTSLFTNFTDMDVSVEQIIENKRFIPTASVLFRKEAIDGYNQIIKRNMDTITWCYLASRGKFRFENRLSSVYRKGNQGITCYTDPYEWAIRMEQAFKDIYLYFGEYTKKEKIEYNIYRQFLYAANKYVDKGNFGMRYWKSVLKGLHYKPLLSIKNMGLYVILHFMKRTNK